MLSKVNKSLKFCEKKMDKFNNRFENYKVSLQLIANKQLCSDTQKWLCITEINFGNKCNSWNSASRSPVCRSWQPYLCHTNRTNGKKKKKLFYKFYN